MVNWGHWDQNLAFVDMKVNGVNVGTLGSRRKKSQWSKNRTELTTETIPSFMVPRAAT